MRRIIIVHRWDGNAESDWYPWLRLELEKLGFEVIIPTMPDTSVPVIENWVHALAEAVGTSHEKTYLIGHSIGCQTILRFLDRFELRGNIGGAIFVAGWFGLDNLESPEVATIAEPWLKTPIDLAKVRDALTRSSLLISDNDPYGCFELNKQKFAALNSEIITLPGAGHFTKDEGYTKCQPILDELIKIL